MENKLEEKSNLEETYYEEKTTEVNLEPVGETENEIDIDKPFKKKKDKKSLGLIIALSVIAAIIGIVFIWRFVNGVGIVSNAIRFNDQNDQSNVDGQVAPLNQDIANSAKIDAQYMNQAIFYDEVSQKPKVSEDFFVQLYFNELDKTVNGYTNQTYDYDPITNIVTIGFDYEGSTYTTQYLLV